jgi:hypothetical protein
VSDPVPPLREFHHPGGIIFYLYHSTKACVSDPVPPLREFHHPGGIIFYLYHSTKSCVKDPVTVALRLRTNGIMRANLEQLINK